MEKENNKFIAVAYKLYSLADGKETLIEEAPADVPLCLLRALASLSTLLKMVWKTCLRASSSR